MEWNGIDDDYDCNVDGRQLHRWQCYKASCIYELYIDGVQKKREKFISSTSCFFFFFLLELLQGLLTTWLQVQKHIGMHSPNANLKTHVQGKQVYVGLHHLVQILYYNQTLCVCACVLPKPKADSKTNFGAARFFLPPKLWNSELHSL